MLQQFTNNAASTLAANIGGAALSLTVATGDGALFPALTGGQYFLATLCKVSSGIEYQFEVVKVTARSGDIFTIVRAQEGTTAQAYLIGDRVSLRLTAGLLATLATLSEDETLANKTITAPKIDKLKDSNGADAVIVRATPGAVNQIALTNSATGQAVCAEAVGADTNIDINLITKGTGVLLVNGLPMQGSSIVRSARTSNTVLAKPDNGTFIDLTSGTFTQTFAAAATLGSGWFCYLRNSGTGDITLDPNASETIDGLASFVMYPGEVRLVQCDGSALRSIVLSAYSRTFTSSSTLTKPPGYRRHVGWLWGAGGSGGKDASVVLGGAGGGCVSFDFADADLGATESVVIGSGGAPSTTSSGNAGGNTTFKGLTAYGGTGGSTASTGGASLISALTHIDCQAFGGSTGVDTEVTTYGGASGAAFTARGRTIYGGGGGGAINSSLALSIFGTTVYGGAGGAAGQAVNGTDGTAPGGGGGSTCTGTQSGAGARGELRIWGVI